MAIAGVATRITGVPADRVLVVLKQPGAAPGEEAAWLAAAHH